MRVDATAHNEASRLALAIYADVLDAVQPGLLVNQAVQRAGDSLFIQGSHIDLRHFSGVWIAGVGKAAVPMALAVSKVLGSRLDGGLIITNHAEPVPGLDVIEGTHPLPTQASLDAGRRMRDFAQARDEKDLVIFVLSGGASSLMEALPEGFSLTDLQVLNQELLRSGADIKAINRRRMESSLLKGGRLAKDFAPATVVVLVLSDVVGSDLSVIGSGPLYDRTGTPPFDHFVIGSVTLAVHAAADSARHHGLQPLPFADPLSGEAKVTARKLCAFAAKQRLAEGCMIFGGETTVKVKGDGLGGRCQEMAVAAAAPLSKLPHFAFLAAGTDGADGPTDAAGGIADSESMERAKEAGLSATTALNRNASYEYLSACGGLIKTGHTGSNVNDIVLIVAAED